jgi:hypothetical protein
MTSTAVAIDISDWRSRGYCFSRDEVAALVALSGHLPLRFLDGGAGRIGVDDDANSGMHSLRQRNLVGVATRLGSVRLNDFLTLFFEMALHYDLNFEVQVSDPRSQVSASHWLIRRGGDLAIVQTLMVAGKPQFWFAILGDDDAVRFLDSAARPVTSRISIDPNFTIQLARDDFENLLVASAARDFGKIDDIISWSKATDAAGDELARFVKEDFRYLSLTKRQPGQTLIDGDRLEWLESERFGFWLVGEMPLDRRVELSGVSRDQLSSDYQSFVSTGR